MSHKELRTLLANISSPSHKDIMNKLHNLFIETNNHNVLVIATLLGVLIKTNTSNKYPDAIDRKIRSTQFCVIAQAIAENDYSDDVRELLIDHNKFCADIANIVSTVNADNDLKHQRNTNELMFKQLDMNRKMREYEEQINVENKQLIARIRSKERELDKRTEMLQKRAESFYAQQLIINDYQRILNERQKTIDAKEESIEMMRRELEELIKNAQNKPNDTLIQFDPEQFNTVQYEPDPLNEYEQFEMINSITKPDLFKKTIEDFDPEIIRNAESFLSFTGDIYNDDETHKRKIVEIAEELFESKNKRYKSTDELF